MRAAALCVAGALVVCAAGTAAADVGDYVGKPLVSIRAEAEGRTITDRRVLELIETRPGEALSMQNVRRTIAHLISLGRFEDVQVQAETGPGGVTLVYDLLPVHAIGRMSFAGEISQPGIDVGRLKRGVTERYGNSPSATRAADMARLIEDQLAERGYLHARVAYRVEREHTPHQAALVFTIEPGARSKVGKIVVTGNPGAPEAQLLSRLRISSGMPYEATALNTRLDEFRQERRAEGYVEVAVAVSTSFDDGDRVVNLTLAVNLGPRVRVVFKGDSLPRDKQTELVPVADEGSADEDLLEDSSNRIQEYFRSAGYRDATAAYTREESDGELLVTFTIVRGPQYRISSVSVTGTSLISAADVEARLRVRVGQPFSQRQLETDFSAIEGYYRQQGFSGVRVTFETEASPAAPPGAPVPVGVLVSIAEQVQTIVRTVRIQGNMAIPDSALREGLGLEAERPFFLTQMAVDRDAIELKYANLGYQNAVVTGNPGISADGSRADVVFTVIEGLQLLVDHILIAGNVRTSSATIERELQIRSGEPLGLSNVVESQRRLAALGLFRRARITQLAHGEEARRDVLVSVEEAPVTTLGYGGGLEVGQRIERTEEEGAAVGRLDVAPRAFFEIGRRNLFDKNRSVNLFTRVSIRPRHTVTVTDIDSPEQGGLTFSEYRVLGTYREPRVLGTAADAVLGATVEQQIRSSFDFARRAFSAEVGHRLTPTVSLSGNYQIQHTRIFNDQINPADRLLIDRLFPQVRLSSFSLSAIRSTRDDAVEPRHGYYMSANGQLAAELIGSEVGFFKSFFTAQFFRSLPRARGAVLATSVRLGMSTAFPHTVIQTTREGDPILDSTGEAVSELARDLPASERFFAGGDTTVRGFALDQLGTAETLDENGFAIGGNGLLILNAELRVPVRGSIGVVGFVDTGNVYSRTVRINLSELRTAVGFGVRYRSPVGPIRVDLGFKLGRRDIVPGVPESLTALHISLGQAF